MLSVAHLPAHIRKDWLPLREAAKKIGVSRVSVYRLGVAGTLKAEKFNGISIVSKKSVAAYMRRFKKW